MSITVFKLTTQDNKTRKGHENECTWGEGVSHSGTGKEGLCGPGYIHAYLSPALAALLNPIHANIPNPRLWECSVDAIAHTDNDLKIGAVRLTTTREVPLPAVTNEQRVIFAIMCAEEAQLKMKKFFEGGEPWQTVYREEMAKFTAWADSYKRDENRATYTAAYAASCAASSAYTATYTATDAAAYAACAAAYAAACAACAASSAYTATYTATDAASKIDIVKIAAKAITFK